MASATQTLPMRPATEEYIAPPYPPPQQPAADAYTAPPYPPPQQPGQAGHSRAASSSAVDLYSASDTDTDDEWFNQQEQGQSSNSNRTQRKPVAAAAAAGPSEPNSANANDPWTTSWDHQPESGPLVIPSLYVSPAPERGAPSSGGKAAAEGLPRPTSAPPGTLHDIPPAYEPRKDERPGLSRTSTNSSDVSDTSLPPYETATEASSTSPGTAPGFHPTNHLQIETKGIGLIRLPVIPPRSDPVLIRSVSYDGVLGPAAYKSLQSSRTSGSCVMVDGETDLPLCTTWYAPGPVRSPKLRIVKSTPGTTPVITPREAGKFMKIKPPYDAELIGVTGDKPHSRACSIRTSLGHFRWRYGTREEKREAKGPIMVFERIREKTLPTGKKQETRKRIGQLLRSETMRSAGSRSTAAGQGGRLMLDLNEWADRKLEGREVEVLAVASCMVMLRKEMSQRRLRQAAVMMTTAAIL